MTNCTNTYGEQMANMINRPAWTRAEKRVILIAAGILIARHLKHENELMVMKIDRLED